MFVYLSVPAYNLCRCLKLFFVGRCVNKLLEKMNAPLGSIIYDCEMDNKSYQTLVVIDVFQFRTEYQSHVMLP